MRPHPTTTTTTNMHTVADYRNRVNKLLAQRRTVAELVKKEEEALNDGMTSLESIIEAQKIAQAVAAQVQHSAHERIAAVVDRCMAAVFDEPYSLDIQFEQKRGKTEAVIQFKRGELVVEPLEAAGGGVVDVAAFALRLACLVLRRPALRRLIVLDEPFRFVHSPRYRERVRTMLETLASEMGVQIIMVTGIDELQCGTVLEMG